MQKGTSFVNGKRLYLVYGRKHKIFLRDAAGNPERVIPSEQGAAPSGSIG